MVCPVIDIISLDNFNYVESATELRGGEWDQRLLPGEDSLLPLVGTFWGRVGRHLLVVCLERPALCPVMSVALVWPYH